MIKKNLFLRVKGIGDGKSAQGKGGDNSGRNKRQI
jgi:hypothetical protein